MNLEQAGTALRRKQLSCTELTEQALSAAARLQPTLNAFITVTAEEARTRARQLDDELARGEDRGPLHGIPIAHKDIILTKGVRTTSGSPLFQNCVPDADAAVVEKLERAGAVSIGKLGLHELAYGVTSNNPHFGAVRNPYNPECIPGGSSGGSGAAVASGIVFMATGTDTGGSIRIPASYCGTVGFKPTYGLVDCAGVRPLGLSLDHVGPLTRTVRDAEIVLHAITSDDGLGAELPTDLIRVGVPENYYVDTVDPEVQAAVGGVARLCEQAGARVLSVCVPDINALNTVGRVILLAEATAVHERDLLKRREMIGEDVLALLDQGRLVSGTEYINAQRLRKRLMNEFRMLFQTIDVLLIPTTPITAPKVGQTAVLLGSESFDTRLLTTRFVRGINVLGLPALSLPCGFSRAGMPMGAQLVGRAFEDGVVLGLGATIERGLALDRPPQI